MGSIAQGRLYFLDVNLSAFPNQNGRLLSCHADGSDLTELVTGMKYMPDGITADAANGHLYWTNMGASMSNPEDGSIQRCDIATGENLTTIVPTGILHTPKQLTLVRTDNEPSSLYWCDREGMRVMRCRLDGSNIEVLVQTGSGSDDRADKRNWCVGIAVDAKAGVVYWSQKGPSKGNQGKILRASTCLPHGQKPDSRTDIEVLLDGLPEPIDLHLDVSGKNLYWTDRGDPPRGNTVNTLALVITTGDIKAPYKERILTRKLHEGIGLAIDEESEMMYFTDLAGGVYLARLDASDKKTLHQDVGDCTGIAFVRARELENMR